MTMRHTFWAAALGLCLATACGDDGSEETGAEDTSGGGTTGGVGESTGSTPSASTGSSAEGSTGAGEGDSGGVAESTGAAGEGSGSTGGPDGSTGAAGSSGGELPAACQPAAEDDACVTCTKDSCCDELDACLANEDCLCVSLCLAEGEQDLNACATETCELEAVPDEATAMLTCAALSCTAECA